MNEIQQPLSPSASYYEPPSFHEVCKCERCHEQGEHDDPRFFAAHGCDGCYDRVQEEDLEIN